MGKKSYIFSHTESYLLTLHLTTNVMRQRYNKIFILLLLVLAAPNAFAQQIKGVVTDSVTHEPLMYISIYYQEKRDMGTITNIDGEYNCTFPWEGTEKAPGAPVLISLQPFCAAVSGTAPTGRMWSGG